MIKLYLRLHNVTPNFIKQFISVSLLLFFILHIGSNAKAQCVVNPVANQTVCNNTATTAINFTGTATTFNWVNNTTSIGLAASGTGNIPSFTALNATGTAVAATITVTPSAGACTGTPISFTITVNPSPVVNVTPTTSCGGVPGVGGPCNPLTASGNADFYVWSPLAGLYTNCQMTQPYIGTNTSFVYAAPSVYTVYTVTGTNATTGCTNSAIAQVNHTPPAPVVTPNPAIMCLGDPAIKLKVGPAANTVQFCSGPINIPVPDNNPAGASNSVAVSGIPASGIITAISLTINMPHTRVGNMVFVLKAPNNAVLNLDYHLSATGGSGPTTGFLNTVISSVNLTLLSTGTNPYTSTFRADTQGIPAGGFGASGPTGMLQTVSTWASLAPTSSNANGNWTLGFYDGVNGDVGTLTSWCLNISYSLSSGSPSTPAVWSPASGLFNDPNAFVPYVPGTAVDSVWARPTPAGTYTYAVTTQSLPVPLCTPTTNFVSTNGNATVTFNAKNNHLFPIVLSQIDSKTLTAGTAIVSAYFKPSPIIGLPGAITPANGWVQFGASNITGTGTGVQTLLTNLSLAMPAATTYAICLQVLTASNAPNLAYSALGPGNYSFNDGGCELITGFFSGTNVPAAPTTIQSGFVGAVHFSRGIVACTSPSRYVIVTVGSPISITAQPVSTSTCTDGTATFSITTAGAGPYTYQWQVSSNGGSTYSDLINGGVYAGVTTATLTVTAPPVSMNGYYYRVVINGTAACAAATSAFAVLTVNPLPNIVISANPLIIGPTQTTTIFSTVTPNPAATYTWYYNNSVLPGEVSANLLVNYGYPGDYQLKVTDVYGCTNLSNILTIANSFALNMYTYPSPSSGSFQVRYHSEVNSTVRRSLVVYNNRGERIMTRNFTQTIPYQKVDVDLRAHGKGLYWIELRDATGKRLAMNRAVVQ